jgi:endogenous inhibitor of DNA gyrase (YacG/DUF329 family)
MTPNDDPVLPPVARCPICAKPVTPVHRPFCSARCRDIDLGRWLKGVYRVETEEGADDTSEETG